MGRSERWTVVYVDDDMNPWFYGVFGSQKAATRFADRIDKTLERDVAGGHPFQLWHA